MSTPERQIKEMIYLLVEVLVHYAKAHGVTYEELKTELSLGLAKGWGD